MNTTRRAGFWIVTVGFGLFVGLALAELATRALSLAPPIQGVFDKFATDPYLPFKPKPNSRTTGQTDEFKYDYQHNSLGFRDVDHQITKSEGTFRILGLGDSFTYGVGVALGETYLSQLELKLDSRLGAHPRVEVIREGIMRYFPEPERIALERYGAQFQPDMVVVGVLPNDVIDTYLGIDAVTVDTSGYLRTREARDLGRLGKSVYRHSHFGRLVLRRFLDRRLQPRWNELSRDGGFHEKDWVTMETEYGRMAAVADSIGAVLVLMHIPQKGPWNHESRYLPSRLSAWAAKRGVHFLDLLPVMERNPSPKRLYYPRDGHTNAAGHAVIADALFRYLTDQQLVP